MKNRFKTILLLCVSFALLAVPISAKANGSGQTGDERTAMSRKQALTPAVVQLQAAMRSLWTDHAFWTRNLIVSDFAGLEDRDKTLARLLKNQQDIGAAIKPYYGEEAGNKLTELLTEHILIGGKILDAAKNGRQAELDAANKEWYRNADDIARFLSGANPNWSHQELKAVLDMHLQLVTADVEARLKKDWDADIAAFDKGLAHLLGLADTLSAGIVKQFPDKFK